FTHLGFTKTYVLPALLVFLIPVIGLAFFYHVRSGFDNDLREAIIGEILEDETIDDERREELIAIYENVPFSQLLTDPEFASQVDSQIRFEYATFEWMIRLSLVAIASGVLVFVLTSLCVLLSLHSHSVQYWSLLVGWHVLRLFGALQVVISAILLVAL